MSMLSKAEGEAAEEPVERVLSVYQFFEDVDQEKLSVLTRASE